MHGVAVIEAVEGEEALAFGRFELRSDGSLLRGGDWVPLTPNANTT